MKWLFRTITLLIVFGACVYASAVYIKREENGTISFSDKKEPDAIQDKLRPGMTLDEFIQRLDKLKQEQAALQEQADHEDQNSTTASQTISAETTKPEEKANLEEKPKREEKPKSEPTTKTEPTTKAEPSKADIQATSDKKSATEKPLADVTYTSFEIQENKANENIFAYPNNTGFAVIAILEPALANGDTVKLEYDGASYDVKPGKEINLSKETSDEEYNKLIKEQPLLASADFVSQGNGTKITITLKNMTMVNFPKGEHTWKLMVYRDGNQLISSNTWTTNNIYRVVSNPVNKSHITFLAVHSIVDFAKSLLAPI